MLFFYIRHGDPTYNPNELTPLGHRQAEAVGKRLALYGVDKIYSSPSNRAIQTAQPTCELLKKDMTLLDFCDEKYAWNDFTVELENGKRTWAFSDAKTRTLFNSDSVKKLGFEWYDHPAFEGTNFKAGIHRIGSALDELFAELGYEHIEHTGTYKSVRPNNDRVALFAHAGFGVAFMSHVIDIPYPVFATRFDMSLSCVTVIDFRDEGELTVPRILTYSSDSHIYKEGLPTKYNNSIRF